MMDFVELVGRNSAMDKPLTKGPSRGVPTIGRIIHVQTPLPDGSPGECQAAIVTAINHDPTQFACTVFSAGHAPNLTWFDWNSPNWHWPEIS